MLETARLADRLGYDLLAVAEPGAFTTAAPAPARDSDEAIVGPPGHWADVLAHFALNLGFDTFILTTPPDSDTLGTFIAEVAPQVRERVTTARAHPTPRQR